MTIQKEIKILGDGHLIWCAWCKVVKGLPSDCDYCFRTTTILPETEVMKLKDWEVK